MVSAAAHHTATQHTHVTPCEGLVCTVPHILASNLHPAQCAPHVLITSIPSPPRPCGHVVHVLFTTRTRCPTYCTTPVSNLISHNRYSPVCSRGHKPRAHRGSLAAWSCQVDMQSARIEEARQEGIGAGRRTHASRIHSSVGAWARHQPAPLILNQLAPPTPSKWWHQSVGARPLPALASASATGSASHAFHALPHGPYPGRACARAGVLPCSRARSHDSPRRHLPVARACTFPALPLLPQQTAPPQLPCCRHPPLPAAPPA